MDDLRITMSDIYYRIYRDKNEMWKVIELQWFEECLFDECRFFNDVRYDTEEEAESVAKILNNRR